jgi:hypothetical protein
MNDKPIKYCREFYKTKFKGKNMKDAYLRAFGSVYTSASGYEIAGRYFTESK